MLICLLASCHIAKPYAQPKGIADDHLYRGVNSTDSTGIGNLSWKLMFTDTLLQKLIEDGIQNNLDLRIAMARIKAAAASLRQSRQAYFPSINGSATASFQEVASGQFGFPQSYQLAVNASWMADIWGQLSSAKKAALANLLQSQAYQKAVQTQLVSDIANKYYLLMALDAELAITEKTLKNRKDEVETLKTLKESDVVTGAAVAQGTANRYSVEITIPDLKQNIRETENALSILLGKNPDTIQRSQLLDIAVQIPLTTGVPALLLSNRPDVQQAEFQLRNAFELVNVARTYFYPSLTITGSGGFAALQPAQIFNTAGFFAGITGNLLQPIFNQGINKARLAAAQAKTEEYVANFKRQVLTAGNEVSNALFSYETAHDKQTLRLQEIAYLEKSVDFTRELLKYSSKANYIDVLSSEQGLLSAQLNSVNDKLQELNAIINLYRSLGGGWK